MLASFTEAVAAFVIVFLCQGYVLLLLMCYKPAINKVHCGSTHCCNCPPPLFWLQVQNICSCESMTRCPENYQRKHKAFGYGHSVRPTYLPVLPTAS